MTNPFVEIELHAPKFGITKDNELLLNNRLITPKMKNVVRFQDDFLGDVLADQWAVVEGADTGTSDAVVTSGIGGTLVLTTGDSATVTYAGNGIQVTHGAFYNWKAANGGLRFATRLKISAITTVAFFVGFTDLGTFEAPIESAGSANTITTNATDAVGFMFDTRMSTDNIWCVGVADDTDATAINSGTAPVADTYIDLEVAIDEDGVALFYINGDAVGRMTGAVTTTVGLTPTIAAASLVAATRTVTVDYVECEMNRS